MNENEIFESPVEKSISKKKIPFVHIKDNLHWKCIAFSGLSKE